MSQFTNFATWADASVLMYPHYVRGSTLEADSPLHAQVERIRANFHTDADRTAAALRLVQDEIRYVALAMGEGGYVPTAADEVWRSRFGDCKGKTVLLLALLRELGIEAEAAMVSTRMGDGLDEREPLIGWFDHVLVRAVVDGKVYWLDGTGVGDRALDDIAPPSWRWALPVRAEGARLEAIESPPAASPSTGMVLDIDASAGIDAEAELTMDLAYYGPLAAGMRQAVTSIPDEQLQTMLSSNWDGPDSVTRVESVDTRYDDDNNAFHIILKGKTRMSWVNGTGGRVMALPDSAIEIPHLEERRGLAAAYRNEPYVIAHPFYATSTIRVTLPNGGEGFRLEGGDQSVEGGGYRVERTASLSDGRLEVSMSVLSLVPEVTAAQMAEARTRAGNLASTGVRVRAPANYVATAADRARVDPGSSDVDDLIERAERLSASGDDEGAIALLDAAVERDPENAKALRARGAARLANLDYAGARADYDAAVDLDPADADSAVGQGAVARSEGRVNDAIVSFSVALRLQPDHLTALAARASAYGQIGRWDRALADYRALKTAAPSAPVALYGELWALRRLNRLDEARDLIRTRLEADPTDGAALNALTAIARSSGNPNEALGPLDAALLAAPESMNLLSLRGQARIRAGDEAGARADFSTLRDLANNDPLLLNNVCWSQAINGFDLELALADCDRAVEAGEANVIDSRAMVLLQLERYAEAKAGYEQALAAAPNLAPSLYGRGLARLALGDEGGREDLARARSLSADVGEDFEVFEARHPELTGASPGP